MAPPRITSILTSLAIRFVRNRRFRQVVDGVLADPGALDTILHRLGTNQMHNADRIDEMMPAAPAGAYRFEDVAWLLSSNYANRGLALLMLDEAIWLFDTLRAMKNPKIAELGRAKGGTTFLMAAAGASVLSLDNGATEAANRRRHQTPTISYDEALGNALENAGLSDRVEVAVADATHYPVPPAVFDLIYFDILLSEDRLSVVLDDWWEGLKDGGLLVLRDGREPRLPAARKVSEAIRSREDVTVVEPAPGVFTVIEKGTVGQEGTGLSIDLTESKSAKIDAD